MKKYALKSLLGLLAGTFLLLGCPAMGASPITDNYDTGSTGSLHGQNDWFTNTGASPLIVDTQYKTTPNSAYWYSATTTAIDISKKGTSMYSGDISFWFRTEMFNGLNGESANIFLASASTTDNLRIRVRCAGGNCSLWGKTIEYYTGGAYTTLADFDDTDWHSVSISFSTSTASYSFDAGSYTATSAIAVDFASTEKYLRLYGFSAGTGGLVNIWLDNIKETAIDCTSYTGIGVQDCIIAGCFWHWGNPTSTSFCTEEAGGCGNTLLSCFNCHSTTTCANNSACYWLNGFCHYGANTCGAGIYRLQFCNSSTTCDSAGGHWYDSFCWITEKSALTEDWSTYYASNSEYATSLDWVNNLASSSGNFLGKIGGFLETFSENFDLQDAVNNASSFGGAIPQARGYMQVFNNLFGGMPISEAIIFVLIFMTAIGVFRAVRNLLATFKFW